MRLIDNIEKSANDDRQYKALELKNGMKVMLISDPNTDKSAAAMDVNVGSLSNPEELPGLAHFCEHMLFLGTKKYPNEDEYHKYISQHGGSANAYTSCEHTNYYFDISHENLKGALDRFGQFFISPLFDANCSDREVNAVHSEHEKNVMSDAWRLHMLDKVTSDPNHSYSKFGTGNKESLDTTPKAKGLCVRDELLKFHDEHYSPNIMGLSILGRETIEEMTDMVTELFSQSANKNVKVPVYEQSPYRDEDVKTRCDVVPVKDMRNLMLYFPIPDLQEFYNSNPGGYLGHLIGHEGPGSLLSDLKSRGWVNSIMAGQKGGARGYDFFMIQVDLTEDGINHVNDIIGCMFQYITMLKEVGPQEWVQQEIKDMNAIGFRFKDKEKPAGYVSKIAQALHYYPPERVLTAGTILTENRGDVVTQILDCLNPSNMKVTVVAKAFEGKTDRTEKWYGTNYATNQIPDEVIEKWRNVEQNGKLRLPDRNEFIPSKLDLEAIPDDCPKNPKILQNNPLALVWFKQDDVYKLPKATMSFDIFSPYAYVDPHHTNMVHLFVDLFNDALNEYSYAAEIAGLGFKLSSTMYGICIQIEGYEDKQKVLLEKILSRMIDFKPDPKRFKILKEIYHRVLQNFNAEQPYNHSVYYSQVVRSEMAWTKNEMFDALPELTYESLTEFIPLFLSHLHVEGLVYGNILKDEARSVVKMAENILTENSTKPLLPSQLRRHRDVELPPGSSYVYKYKHLVRDTSAIQVFLQVGLQNTRDNVLTDLFSQIISEPFFNILRTKEQLGYIVHGSPTRSNGTQGLRFIIQSEKTPDYLDARVEAFLDHAKSMIEEMEESEFCRHKAALKTRRLEKPKKMKTQSQKFWGEILSQQYMFERDEIEMEHLDGIQKDDVLQFYEKFINPASEERAKLATYVIGKSTEECPTGIDSKKHNELLEEGLLKCPEVSEVQLIDDIQKFRDNHSLYPRKEAYLDFAQATI